MLRYGIISVAVVGFLALNVTNVPAQDHDDATHDRADAETRLKAQTTCPVMEGGAINANLYVDHEGQRIHVCCAGCIDVVKADPAKAIATLAEQGQAPRQALCPVMGKPINAKQFVDHDGQRIYVCCAGCVGRVKRDPEAALKKLHEQGVAPAKAGDEPVAAATPNAHEHHHH